MGAVRERRARGRGWSAGATMVALAALAGLGCSQEYRPGRGASSTSAPEIAPRPAFLGEEATHAGVEVIVVDVTAFDRSPDGVPRVRAVIRTENVDDVDRQNPLVALRCAESGSGGDWFRGSTWEPGQLLTAGSVSEGVLLVGFPPKDDAPLYSVATCTDARLEVTLGGPTDARIRLDYAVPPEVIAEAIDRPRGKPLPLPLETR